MSMISSCKLEYGLIPFLNFFLGQAIRFFGSTNLTMRGIKVINSPQFHIRFDVCQNISVDSIVIKSPGNSPNTDGIHVENTNDVMIHNSVISNGKFSYWTKIIF